METRSIPLAVLLALSAAGNVYFVYQGTTYRAAVAMPSTDTVRLTGAAAAPFIAKAQEAGAVGEIECKRAVISNHPDRVYCTDGKSAGWLIGMTMATALLNEVKAKLPGITADEVRLVIDEQGQLWASQI